MWGALGLLGGALLGGWFSRRNTQDTNRANRIMADRAFQNDQRMWKIQNEYNSPQAQMARFQSAGLNPNLIYGQGSPGNANQMPQYQAPRMDYRHDIPDFGGMMGQYLDLRHKSAQVDLTKAQTDVQESIALLQTAQTARIWQENTIKGIEEEITRYILNNKAGEIKQMAHGRIGGIKAEDWLKKATAEIKQWEKGLTDQNINPQDSTALRFALEFLKSIGFTPDQINSELKRQGIKTLMEN